MLWASERNKYSYEYGKISAEKMAFELFGSIKHVGKRLEDPLYTLELNEGELLDH